MNEKTSIKKFVQYRQGDVLVERIETIPASAKKLNTKVVAEGEGHHEHIIDSNTDILMDDENMYLAVGEDGQLEHVVKGTSTKAEHNTIPLPAGNYRVIQQREYDPYENLIRQLRD